MGTSSPLSILYSMDPTAVNKLEDGSYNPNAGFEIKYFKSQPDVRRINWS